MHMLQLQPTFGIFAGLTCTYSCSFWILRLIDESIASSVLMGSPANSCPTSVLYVFLGWTEAGLAMQPQQTPTILFQGRLLYADTLGNCNPQPEQQLLDPKRDQHHKGIFSACHVM